MSKKTLECEYCHTLIGEDDVKCPHCGANCSSVIKKYREEQNKKEKEEKEEALKAFTSITDTGRRIGSVFSIVFIVIFITIFVFAFIQIRNTHKEFSDKKTSIVDDNNTGDIEEKEEKVIVNYNEVATTKEMSVILDSYDLYEHHSDNFDSYNTPKGYQKIAFHFSIENLGEHDISTYSLITLTADDSKVETAKLDLNTSFAKLVKGKEKYESVVDSFLGSGNTLKGYVGYLVPTDKKVLKFYVGDYIVIQMDNPVYKG